mgnify:CR=1 FL=1|tara:strand:- start:712 stop:894 length:183 start_codon:yes stop_codon:yes gene_type:complete
MCIAPKAPKPVEVKEEDTKLAAQREDAAARKIEEERKRRASGIGSLLNEETGFLGVQSKL